VILAGALSVLGLLAVWAESRIAARGLLGLLGGALVLAGSYLAYESEGTWTGFGFVAIQMLAIVLVLRTRAR